MTRDQGFTLVEILVVLTIIGVIAGVGIPVSRSMIQNSREAACLSQLRPLGVALETYLQENGGTMPVLAAGRASRTDDTLVLETVLAPYVAGANAFLCPADFEQFKKSGSSYLWNSTQNGLRVSQLAFFGIRDRPDKIPLITDKEAWHPRGTNFLYADMSSSNRTRFAAGN